MSGYDPVNLSFLTKIFTLYWVSLRIVEFGTNERLHAGLEKATGQRTISGRDGHLFGQAFGLPRSL